MLTQNGIDYICQNFGDSNFCCVDGGLSWYYTSGGTNTNETGATAQIVSRLASGLVDSVTMINPSRGTFTQAQLNTANGQTVTLQDAQSITSHDSPSEDQWCYGGTPPPQCSDYTDQYTCESNGCYWCDGICQSTPCGSPPACEDYTNSTDCVNAGCYWWSNGTCHSSPEPSGDCESYTTQSACIGAGCFWYQKYLWEPAKCHSAQQNMMMDYLPYIVIGVGGLLFLGLLLSRGSSAAPVIITGGQ